MALTIGDNFSYQGAKPLDTRLQYATIAEMVSKADSTLYDGIIAYCKADSKNYQWKSTNTVDPILGKWREFQSGGGGASELANLDDVDLDAPTDGEVLKYDATEEKWVNGEDVGGAGRAKSSAIAPVFDDTETYAAGDRVMYEDELYVFNTAHTGAWDAADADKSDVDSEIPDKLTSQQMQDIKDAFSGMNKGAPLRMMNYSTDEQVVGTWIDGKPLYQKTYDLTLPSTTKTASVLTTINNIANMKIRNMFGLVDGSVNAAPYVNVDRSYIGQETPVWIRQNGEIAITSYSSEFVNAKLFLTIQYTKTTDTPQ